MELAEAIANPQNPLTARVMVNRIWLHHFGQGIVRTPSNFGQLGERPTHPELLDYLAARFVQNGWSIKAMHREIVLSATYALSIENSEKMVKKLTEVGVSARLVTMEGEGHGWGGEKLTKALNETVRFFQEKLKK